MFIAFETVALAQDLILKESTFQNGSYNFFSSIQDKIEQYNELPLLEEHSNGRKR